MWENLGLIILGIAIGLAIYRLAISKQPLTVENVTAAVDSVPVLTGQIEKVVQIGANAAEAYRKDGTFQTTDEMSEYVLNFVKEWVPATRSMHNQKIIAFVKSAALVSSALTHQIKADKATVQESAAVVADIEDKNSGNQDTSTYLRR